VSYGGLPNSDMDRSLDSVGSFTRIRHDAVRCYQVLGQRDVGDFAGKKMLIVRPQVAITVRILSFYSWYSLLNPGSFMVQICDPNYFHIFAKILSDIFNFFLRTSSIRSL
jgi:hypothetical protein